MDGATLSLNGRPRSRGGDTPSHVPTTRSLVLWSGGVDSSYCVLRLLRETPDAVFSHHVVVEHAEPNGDAGARGAFQCAAVSRLRPALAAAARPFVHTESRVDLSRIAPAGGAVALLGFMAAQAAMGHEFTPFDRVLIGVNGDEDPGWHPDSAACALRRARLARALRAAWGCDEVPHVYLWEPRPCKSEMVDYLGADLAALTVSCAQPRRSAASDPVPGSGLVACGGCAKCRLRSRWSHAEAFSAATDMDDGVVPVRAAAGRSRSLFQHLEEREAGADT